MHAVHADANGHGKSGFDILAFDQNAGKLLPSAENVIRPFQRKFFAQRGGAIDDRVKNGKRGDERQLRCVLGRGRIANEQRGVEIAGRRNPCVAAPAAARSLLPRRDPERPRFAAPRQRQSFGVGRRQRVVGQKAKTGRRGRGIKPHQNRERAAALAAPTSGPG